MRNRELYVYRTGLGSGDSTLRRAFTWTERRVSAIPHDRVSAKNRCFLADIHDNTCTSPRAGPRQRSSKLAPPFSLKNGPRALPCVPCGKVGRVVSGARLVHHKYVRQGEVAALPVTGRRPLGCTNPSN